MAAVFSFIPGVKWVFKNQIRSASSWCEFRVHRSPLLEKLTLQEVSLVIGSLRKFLNQASGNFNPNQGRDWESFISFLNSAYEYEILAILEKMGGGRNDLTPISDNEVTSLTTQFDRAITIRESTSLPDLRDLKEQDRSAPTQHFRLSMRR